MKRSDDPARPAAMGRAIRRYRGEINQSALALRAGVSQATVSNWELGIVELSCEQVSILEGCFGLSRGTLLIEAGYVDQSFFGLDAATGIALGRLESAISLFSQLGYRSPAGLCESLGESGEQRR